MNENHQQSVAQLSIRDLMVLLEDGSAWAKLMLKTQLMSMAPTPDQCLKHINDTSELVQLVAGAGFCDERAEKIKLAMLEIIKANLSELAPKKPTLTLLDGMKNLNPGSQEIVKPS